jgi:hypothetical protein
VGAKDVIGYLEHERTGYRIDAGELNKGLENLFHRDLLKKEPDRDAYTFKMDLWRLWITRMHSVWQVIDEMERSEGGVAGKGIVAASAAGRWRRLILLLTPVAVGVIAIALLLNVRDRIISGSPGAFDQRAYTTLSVETSPDGAQVFVDDTRVGYSPVVAESVLVSSKVVRVELAGYRTVIDSVLLEEGRPARFDYALAELMGNLDIRSEPPGAEITVNGAATAFKTPAVITGLSASGAHDIELSLPGHNTKLFGGMPVTADSTSIIEHRFTKKRGTLSVVTEPAGAEVHVDGSLVDTTPCVVDLAYGTHSIRLLKPGYCEAEVEKDLRNPSDRLNLALSPLPPGVLVFEIEPYGSIYMDGELVKEDATHHEVQVVPGNHLISIRHPQFEAHDIEVLVESGESIEVPHRFNQ